MKYFFSCCFFNEKNKKYKSIDSIVLIKNYPIEEYFYNQDLEDKYILFNIKK